MNLSYRSDRPDSGPFQFTPIVATSVPGSQPAHPENRAQRDPGGQQTSSAAGESKSEPRRVGEPVSAWASASVVLTRLSFGAAEVYANGGLPVLDDRYPAHEALDIAERGREFFGVLPADDREPDRVTAAYVVGTRTVVIKLWLLADPWLRGARITIRARAGSQARIHARELLLDKRGLAEAELEVVGLDLSRTGTIEEEWTWEYSRPGEQAFFSVAIESAQASPFDSDRMVVAEKIPVRIYIKESGGDSRLPCDSFYHIACRVGGAEGRARDKVWQAFTEFRHHPYLLSNARGVPLKFWGDTQPGEVMSPFILRDARDLVVHGDSSCYGWADLLRQAFAIHGIRSRIVGVRPSPELLARKVRPPDFLIPDGLGSGTRFIQIGFMLKRYRWDLAGRLQPPTAGQYVLDARDFRWRVNVPGNPLNADWDQQDVENLGRPQRMCRDEMSSRHGTFANHAVVLIEEAGEQTWYDPAYGLGPYDNLIDYEQDLLGFGERDCGGYFGVIGVRLEQGTDENSGRPTSIITGHLMGACPAVAPGNLAVDELSIPQ